MPHSKLLTLLGPSILALSATAALAQATQGGSGASGGTTPATCNDPALGPVDCVPTTFDTFDIPFDKLPGGRMDKNGNLDNGCTAWGTTSPNRPNCTGTLTGTTVTNTPCVARDFFRSSTPDEFELLDP